MDFYEKIRTLPTQPGVYLYKNAKVQVIYVGNAGNLRSRVRSHLLAVVSGVGVASESIARSSQ